MKLVQISILGLVLLGAGLAAFVFVSRTRFADLGKPFVIALAFLGVGLLLWRGVRNVSGVTYLFLLPAMLALGYIAAFHLVGEIGFPGLLRDVRPFTGGYVWSVLRVTSVVFCLYGIATALLFILNRTGHRRVR